jgi:arylsulfatase A-like enzyme
MPSSPIENVVYIHCHDLGRFLGCYGRDIETPAIDTLAAEGTLLEQCFCTAAQCGPSRASILTGQYPHEHGLMGHAWLGWSIDEDVPTLPEQLSAAGFATQAFGVLHEALDATTIGYDAHDDTTTAADRLADRSVTALPALEADAPFFASVGFGEPHRRGMAEGFDFGGDDYPHPDPSTVSVPPYLPDTEGVRTELAEFRGMVRVVDEAVGHILDGVEAAGCREETLIVFTTDHGAAFPRAKGTCYDAGLETACVLSHPDIAAQRCDRLVSQVDLMPTILDLLEIPTPETVSGVSFAPAVQSDDEAEPHRDAAFCEMTYHDKYNPMRGIRTGRYKYIRNFGELPQVYLPLDILHSRMGFEVVHEYYGQARPTEELYDLEDDPHEQENLAENPAYQEQLTTLRGRVEDWMERTDDPLCSGRVDPPTTHVDRLITYPY